MAESTCLHIQEHDAGPIRIVEIPWISARVGRAAFCEVRLNDPSLPEEACRLHRRGRTWHLTALGGSEVLLDGAPIGGARPLPFDVPFQVGPFRLSLKSSKFAEPDWRPPRDDPAPRIPRTEAPAAPPTPIPTPVAAPTPANPWEARWRAAGDRLKAARAAEARPAPAPAAPPPADRRPPREAPPAATPKAEPLSRARPSVGPTSRPRSAAKAEPARFAPPSYARVERPTVAPSPTHYRRPEPRPSRPAARLAPEIRPAPPIVPAPAPRPAEPSRYLDDERVARLENLDVSDLGRELAAEAQEVQDAAIPDSTPASAPAPAAIRRLLPRWILLRRVGRSRRVADAPVEPIAETAPVESQAATVEIPAAPAPEHMSGPAAAEVEPLTPDEAPEPIRAYEPAPRPDIIELDPATEARAGSDPEPDWTYCPVVEPAGHARRFVADTSDVGAGHAAGDAWLRFEADPQPLRPTAPAPRVSRDEVDDAESFDPTRSRRSRGGDALVLPSVQDVLNAGLRRARDRGEAGTLPRPAARPPRPSSIGPTIPVAPAQWSLPAWLAAPPAMALALAFGGLLAFCSWRQATVSHGAAAAMQSTAAFRRNLSKDRPLGGSIAPPSPSWWGAAPAHLAEWGAYLDGTRVEHGWDATAPAMLQAAVAVGPLDPLARFALARKAGDGRPSLGLSRDIVSLAWTGRALHRAGKDAEATRAYRRAMEIAAEADPTPVGVPSFSEDPDVPRYLLPGEEVAVAVVRELAADGSWSYADWAGAVPESGVSALAAARVLKKMGRPEADAILKRILDRAEADAKARVGRPDAGADDPDGEALALAVSAEALALRADWQAAERRYRVAIDLMGDPRVRRSWWFNLADVAGRSNNDDQRREALDEALASTDSDDVSRRALNLQRGGVDPGPKRPRSGGVSAN